MKKRFLFLGLVTCLAMFISCANAASSSSDNDGKSTQDNNTDNGKKFSQFDLRFRTMENNDFYETDTGNHLIFYEGITKIKGIIIPVDNQEVNGTMVNAYLNNPSEYTTEFYVEDKLASQRLNLKKQNDGTYTFDIDTDTLVNGSLKKYEIRYKHKGDTKVNTGTISTNVTIVEPYYSKYSTQCGGNFLKTRKKMIIEESHFKDSSNIQTYLPDNDGNYLITVYYRGVDINNIEVDTDYYNYQLQILNDTIIYDSSNNINKINVKVIEINPIDWSGSLEDSYSLGLICDGYYEEFDLKVK